MLANLKKLAKEFNARQTGEIVWEVSSIEFTSGKRNTTNVLFRDFEESNKFYQNVVNTFKLENVVEVLTRIGVSLTLMLKIAGDGT